MAVQVNGASGGQILYPGSGARRRPRFARIRQLRDPGPAIRRQQFSGYADEPGDGDWIGHRWQLDRDQSMELPGGQHLCRRAKRQRQRACRATTPRQPDSHPALDDRDRRRLDDGLCNRQQQDDDRAGQRRVRRTHPRIRPGRPETAGISVTLAAINYEFLAVQFDGSNFRIVSITPRTASALGMLGHQVIQWCRADSRFGTERLRNLTDDRRQ